MGIGGNFSWLRAGSDKERILVPLLCGGFIALSAAPVVFGWAPVPTASFFSEYAHRQIPGYVCLAVGLGTLIILIARRDGEPRPWNTIRHIAFALLAVLLTDIHFFTVDVLHLDWQWQQYLGVLYHACPPPDQYRFLSQGTLWWMLLTNGDFVFSYLAYRFFFTFLLCQAIYKLARLYLAPLPAVIVVLLYAVFYPLSIRYYHGNLCDPTSHAVMLLALLYCARRKFGPVLALMVLGTFIKETMLVLAPCWLLLDLQTPPQRNYRGMLRMGVLLAGAALAFLACRLPFHFSWDFPALNRTTGLMIWSNLGFPSAQAGSSVSVFQRYLHPALFIFMWLPIVITRRDLLHRPLFRTAIYFSAALYVINLCFGWNYESRNFIPGLVVLIICTVLIATTFVPENPQTKATPPYE